MDLVREILLAVEAAPHDIDRYLQLDGKDQELVDLHVKLLEQAGFLTPARYVSVNKEKFGVGARLTWDGHEFLESIRDPKIWEDTKSNAKAVGSWSLGILGELAKGLIKQKAVELGLPLA